jgi:urease accessory protein
MLTVTLHLRFDRIETPPARSTVLSLDYDARKRSRQRLAMDDGRELAVALQSGAVLMPGDLLQVEEGEWFVVQAKSEAVLRVRAADHRSLLAAAYHLGNRHVPVQVAADHLLLEPDPVLRDMLLRLGVDVDEAVLPFQPESGAYGGGHRHGHDASFAEDYALAQEGFRAHAAVPFRAAAASIAPEDYGAEADA